MGLGGRTKCLLSLAVALSSSAVQLVRSQSADAEKVSFSALDFKTCASGAEFKLTNKDGVGQIIDKDTDRCLTVKKCSEAWPSTACTNACTHGNGDVVVLEDCSLDDTCEGATSQWKAEPVPGAASTFFFTSQAADKTKCLNAVGDPSATFGYKLVVWDCGAPTPGTNNAWSYDDSTGYITTKEPYAAAPCDKSSCCLTPDPCTAPCELPSGWGAVFLLIFFVATAGYLIGGAGYAVKVQGKDYRTDGFASLAPHWEQWANVAGLCKDGMTFSYAYVQAKRNGGDYSPIAAAKSSDVADEPATSKPVDPDSPLRKPGDEDKPLFDAGPASKEAEKAGSGSDEELVE